MAVPASRVRTVCTAAEAALVRASRPPELGKLAPSELKRKTVRARALADKWRGLSQSQARTAGKEPAANTALKAQIFDDALRAFEQRLAKLDTPKKRTDDLPAAPNKHQRNAQARRSRAKVRKKIKRGALD